MKMLNSVIIKKVENSLQFIENVPPKLQLRSLCGTVLISGNYRKWTATCLSHQRVLRGNRHYISVNTPSYFS